LSISPIRLVFRCGWTVAGRTGLHPSEQDNWQEAMIEQKSAFFFLIGVYFTRKRLFFATATNLNCTLFHERENHDIYRSGSWSGIGTDGISLLLLSCSKG